MITIVNKGRDEAIVIMRGLSTDTKPTNVPNGSEFQCMDNGKTFPVKLVHWGNFGTMKAQYLLEVERLDRDRAGRPMTPLGEKLRYCLLLRHDFLTLLKRIRLRLRLLVKTGHMRP